MSPHTPRWAEWLTETGVARSSDSGIANGREGETGSRRVRRYASRFSRLRTPKPGRSKEAAQERAEFLRLRKLNRIGGHEVAAICSGVFEGGIVPREALMRTITVTIALGAFVGSIALAQAKFDSDVDFGMMTWVEVKHAIESGKTTALVYNGGTEQRGPQNVNGGHTLMGHATVLAIARKLGNAIAAPVMPFSVNRASADLPGTIGLTGPVFAALNEEVAEQMIKSGFKSVVLMGDHGGGQKELGEVAKKLDEKYAGKGIRVVFCDEVYAKANGDFDKWLAANGYPLSLHALAFPDTSGNGLYLGANKGWVRKELVATAVGDPMRKPGEARDPNEKRINNGISGDGRKSSAELGKRMFDMKVDYAVRQINLLLGPAKAAGVSGQ